MARQASIGLLVCWLIACGTGISYLPTQSPPGELQPHTRGEVEVYTATRPDRPFVEIGILEANSGTDMPSTISAMRAKAAEVGCHAIFITGSADIVVGSSTTTTHTTPAYTSLVGYPSVGSTSSQTTGGVSTIKGYRAACIVYTVAAEAPHAPEVEDSTPTDPNGNHMLRMHFERGGFEFKLKSVPATEQRRVWLGIHVAAIGDCNFQFMIDGAIAPINAPLERTFPKAGQTVWTKIEYKDFYRIARASRVAIRGCDGEARFESREDSSPLRDFALRIIDELTWLGRRTAEDTLDQPPSAIGVDAGTGIAGTGDANIRP